jgi:type II secretory pathway predicted ATPase ExeA/septal ring-binding cell division protein DamX
MYYSFFGLSQPPFKITPDTEMFYDGGNRGAILEALMYAITHGEGIIKVTGEVGSGKTMLCRMLQTRLPENVETIYLANPSVSRDEILQAIAFELQLHVPKDENRIEVMRRINDYLLERHADGKHVVLFVEESQSMPLETLEEIRLLSNLETGHHKLLQIILFGQPELDDNLRLSAIRQLRERITHSFSLTPLSADDTRRYLTFRLRTAGYRGPDLFNQRVAEYITRVSEGLTRRINIVADKALLAAFADGTHNVSLKHARAAVRDTEFAGTTAGKTTMSASSLGYIVVGLFVGGALGVTALIAYQHMNQETVERPKTAAEQNSSTNASAQPADQANDQDQPTYGQSSATPAASVQASPPRQVAETQPSATAAMTPANPGTGQAARDAQQSLDLLERRLRETERWLAQTDNYRFTIQLLGTNNAEYLRDDLETIGNIVEIDRVFVYRTLANGEPSYTVLLGTYDTRSEALRELDGLPDSLRANGPYFRTIRGVKNEIARNGI